MHTTVPCVSNNGSTPCGETNLGTCFSSLINCFSALLAPNGSKVMLFAFAIGFFAFAIRFFAFAIGFFCRPRQRAAAAADIFFVVESAAGAHKLGPAAANIAPVPGSAAPIASSASLMVPATLGQILAPAAVAGAAAAAATFRV